jgi:hypothetical protein
VPDRVLRHPPPPQHPWRAGSAQGGQPPAHQARLPPCASSGSPSWTTTPKRAVRPVRRWQGPWGWSGMRRPRTCSIQAPPPAPDGAGGTARGVGRRRTGGAPGAESWQVAAAWRHQARRRRPRWWSGPPAGATPCSHLHPQPHGDRVLDTYRRKAAQAAPRRDGGFDFAYPSRGRAARSGIPGSLPMLAHRGGRDLPTAALTGCWRGRARNSATRSSDWMPVDGPGRSSGGRGSARPPPGRAHTTTT